MLCSCLTSVCAHHLHLTSFPVFPGTGSSRSFRSFGHEENGRNSRCLASTSEGLGRNVLPET